MPSSVAAVLRRLTDLRLRREEEGQDLLEYGLLSALIAVIAIGAVTTVGNTINHRVLDGDCQQFLTRRSWPWRPARSSPR